MERWCRTSRSILRAMRLVTPGKPPKCSRRGRAAYGSVAAIIVPIGPPAHPSYRGSPAATPLFGGGAAGAAPIVLPSPYGPRMQTPRSAPRWRPTGARRTGAKGNATTEVLDQAVAPAPSPDLARQDDPDRDRSGPGLGRLGRAEAEEPSRRSRASYKRRFVQTLSFCAIFFAGLALSAGAGNGVLLGCSRPTGRLRGDGRDRRLRAERRDRRDRRDRRPRSRRCTS